MKALGLGDTTWYRERLANLGRPILWRARVASGRRNARKGVGHSWLKVRANPAGNGAVATRPDKSKCVGAKLRALLALSLTAASRPVEISLQCCDALRCSGPHARYTDRASEYFLGRNIWVILLNSVVLGIEHCNYCSSTRNS